MLKRKQGHAADGDDDSMSFVMPTKGKPGPQKRPNPKYTESYLSELFEEGLLRNEPTLVQELQALLTLRDTKKDEWEIKTKKFKVWSDIATLQHILNTEMMIDRMVPSDQPTAVILTGPAGSGKSAALPMVGSGIQDYNTVIVDPDRIFEWFAGKYGYFPPEIIMKDPDRYKDPPESNEAYEIRRVAYRNRLKEKNLARLRWWIANKETFEQLYGNDFEDERVHERRFEAAKYCTSKTAGVLGQYKFVLPRMSDMIFKAASLNRANVLLDTTGGMQGTFLEEMATQFKDAKYRVVVVLVVSSEDDCAVRVSNHSGRNEQQHRQIDGFTVRKIWRDFVEHETSCRWESFSHTTGADFVVVHNNWTPAREGGSARVVFRRSEGHAVPVTRDELLSILETYNVTISDKAGVLRFKCIGESYRGEGGYRKRRISTQRLHIKRPRKTMKKYARRVTRRRGGRGHSRVGRRHTHHNRHNRHNRR